MGSLSNFAELEFLDHLLGVTAWTTPAAVYLSLHTANPDEDASGAECSGSGYTRKVCSFGSAASRSIAQDVAVQFAEATGSWGTVSHWALWDTLTTGNMLAYGSFGTATAVGSGEAPSIASGTVVVSVSALGASNYLANAMLDHIFNSTAFTQPDIHVAICSAAITDSSTGTSITDLIMTGYAREDMSAGGTDWDTAASGASANKLAISFGTLTGTGETALGVCICDAATDGNLLVYKAVSQVIATSDVVQFPIGDFDITLG